MLVRSRLEEVAQSENLALLIMFGSTARGADRPGDLDLALLPQEGWLSERPPDLWVRWAEALGRGDLDLVWLPAAGWLVSQQVARHGVPLYQSEPGRFRAFQIAAELRSGDAGIWRRREQNFLRGTTPLDVDLVRHKAVSLKLYLRDLVSLLERGSEAFQEVPNHYAGERLLELLVETASAINTEVAQGVSGIPASDYYSSFFSMARTGWITNQLAMRLAPLARLRNVLVHHYEDIDLATLFTALESSVPDWTAYLEGVESGLARSPS